MLLHCIRGAFYQSAFNAQRKTDLIVGNNCDYRYDYETFSFMMKLSLPLALLAAAFFASCSEEPTIPTTQQRRPAPYASTQTQEYPPPQQPFNPNGPAQPVGTPPPQVATSPPPAAAPPPTKVAKGDYPYGIPVPGKPHLVESPYSPGKYIDVEGFPPGTEVKDPYTDKIFLVP
jgi:hypothetical protein